METILILRSFSASLSSTDTGAALCGRSTAPLRESPVVLAQQQFHVQLGAPRKRATLESRSTQLLLEEISSLKPYTQASLPGSW